MPKRFLKETRLSMSNLSSTSISNSEEGFRGIFGNWISYQEGASDERLLFKLGERNLASFPVSFPVPAARVFQRILDGLDSVKFGRGD